MNKRNLFLSLALFLMAGSTLSAQNKSAGINLSIWKGVSTQPTDSAQTTYFNLGILSAMSRLNGMGFNVLGSVVSRNMNGIQASGLANMVGGNMRGLQLSAISNISGNSMTGLSATGLVNIAGDNSKGVIISGLTSISGDHTYGVIASGVMNISGDRAGGVQLAGLANVTGSTFNGIMTGGLLNVVSENLNGVQLTGLANIVVSRMNGAQIGLANYATKAKGLQIGLVNYYKEEMKGFQLGLVNANPDTRVQMMLFGGNATKINMGVRFKNRLFYTIIGAGTHYLDFSDKFSASVFYRGGIWLPLWKDLSISGDLGYQHIETFKNKDNGIPAHLYGLQARLNLEYQITSKFGVFATGGYGGSRYYNKDATYDKGAIVEAGIVLF